MTTDERIGKCFAEQREALGISQQEAAQAIGCSLNRYKRIEQGTSKAKFSEGIKLSDLTGKSLEELFTTAMSVN